MADNEQDQEKTLDPTERRLEQAREEGQVPRSAELPGAAILIVSAGMLAWGGMPTFESLRSIVSQGLRLPRSAAMDPAEIPLRLAHLGFEGLIAMLPMLAALFLVGALAPLALGGWNVSWKAIAPQASRISPMAGVKRVFSAQGATEFAKMIVKATVLFVVAAQLLWGEREMLSRLGVTPIEVALGEAGSSALHMFTWLAGVLAVVAAIDAPIAFWRFRSGLKMTLEEVKREAKETEGDPHVKGRMRQQQRAMAQRRMMSEIPKADVVVTNSTHFAVALAYNEDGAGAPRVVAKGTDLVAARIREAAAKHGVPLLEAPPLARALHASTEIGQEIPAPLYSAVAQVLAWVYQLRRATGPQPVGPTDLPVPPELDPFNKPAGANI